MAKVTGRAVIVGIREPRPIATPLPPDAKRIKIRMRPTEPARAYVRFPDRVEVWIVEPTGGMLNADTWELLLKQGVNWGSSADATKPASSE
jgi:hypothetical protein